ncbi:MAG: DNA mismatch repair protein MutS [Candidatus Eisenbacteria bacterium]|nr:DNA mismatch repair protein MutS [Candidatus Eisenbacteria bacterium]
MSKGATGRVAQTPMMAQYLRAKAEHPDAILLFRMGDFYETFFEDAEVLSRVTSIVLTSRNAGDPDPIPLAGFPWHSAEGHIAKLLAAGYRVAICEQVEEPGAGKKLLERKVVEVLSPGTALADSQLDASANNYLVALHADGDRFGIAIGDVSTGELWLGDLSESDAEEEIVRTQPAEILWTSDTHERVQRWLVRLERSPFQTELDVWRFGKEKGRRALEDHLGVATLDGFECGDLGPGLAAGGALLEYVRAQKQSELRHWNRIRRLRPGAGLVLDESTLRSLEILDPMPGATREATLVHVLDRTRTASGARRLRQELRRPSTDRNEILRRQDAIEALRPEAARGRLRDALGHTADVERILARLHCQRVSPRDLGALRSTLLYIPEITELIDELDPTRDILPWIEGDPEDGGIEPGDESEAFRAGRLGRELDAALADELPSGLGDGGVFRDSWDETLAESRSLARDAKGWIARLQQKEREETGIPNLKVGFNRVFGYFLEVTKAQHDKVPDHYQRKQTLVSAERYITPELKEFEEKVLGAEETAVRRERELWNALVARISEETTVLQSLSRQIAALDFLQSLADVSMRGAWVRPEIEEGPILELEDARHPVVERAIGSDRFIANDTHLDREERQLAILTGPNMAGKSTFLRQVGLLVVLAQIGCYLPVTSAKVGLCDRVFTRVGAQDSLARGQSTFLLEMVETSRILHHATERSLVLLDEVGRGTSTYDGLAIAWAVAEAISAEGTPRPRTIFATHFHELTILADRRPGVHNLNVQVKEWGDEIVFVRKVVPGGADRSYGIHVAQLAGIPDEVIGRAREVLAELEHEGRNRSARVAPGSSVRGSSPGTPGGPSPTAGLSAPGGPSPATRSSAPDGAPLERSGDVGVDLSGSPAGSTRNAPGGASPGASSGASGGAGEPGVPRQGGVRSQLSLFAPPEPEWVRELRRLDLDRLAPIQAWELLRRWQSEAEGGEGGG